MSRGLETKESKAWGVGGAYVWIGLAEAGTRRRVMGVPVGF